MTSPWEHLSVPMLDRFSTRTWLTRFDSVIVTMIMVAICLKEKGRLHKNMKHLLDSENLENLLEGYSSKKQLIVFYSHEKLRAIVQKCNEHLQNDFSVTSAVPFFHCFLCFLYEDTVELALHCKLLVNVCKHLDGAMFCRTRSRQHYLSLNQTKLR